MDNETIKNWALKVQEKDALVFAALGSSGRTLRDAIAVFSSQPLMGLVRLPADAETLIATGNVWIDATVCKDPARVLKAGSFIAIYPDATMYLHEDGEGRRSLRKRD